MATEQTIGELFDGILARRDKANYPLCPIPACPGVAPLIRQAMRQHTRTRDTLGFDYSVHYDTLHLDNLHGARFQGTDGRVFEIESYVRGSFWPLGSMHAKEVSSGTIVARPYNWLAIKGPQDFVYFQPVLDPWNLGTYTMDVRDIYAYEPYVLPKVNYFDFDFSALELSLAAKIEQEHILRKSLYEDLYSRGIERPMSMVTATGRMRTVSGELIEDSRKDFPGPSEAVSEGWWHCDCGADNDPNISPLKCGICRRYKE